jgi:hypothetical protein
MHLRLHLPGGGPPTEHELARPVTAGGSRADDLRLPGCPAAALRLVPSPAGVVVEAIAAGVRVGGHVVHAGARRLLRAGERAELRGAVLVLVRPPAPAASDDPTRVAAAALIRGAASGDVAPPGLHLVVLTGPAAGARRALAGDTTVGRGRAASVVLPDPAASRVHARLRTGPEGATVEDLGSKNGVRVNGVRVDRRPFPVRAGDELVVGETALALADGEAGDDSPAPARRRVPARLVAAALLALSAAALALAAG